MAIGVISTSARTAAIPRGKFSDPWVTATGESRAEVDLVGVETLWFNTGTRCNIECPNCYIKSSPTNDALVYMRNDEVESYLREVRQLGWPTKEIGFTGGEPFMNPDIVQMLAASLDAGFRALVLTNAMRPMMRPRVQRGLLELLGRHGHRLRVRVSVDHYSAELHDRERGEGSFAVTLKGMRWLSENGFLMEAAGRSMWEETEDEARAGFAELFRQQGFDIDAHDPVSCVIFPEMDETADVPEITEACWGLLGVNPADVMCATSRMVIKRRGASRPSVVACTLITEDAEFELGARLADSVRPVRLNHPHCSKFCVLGGANCSAARDG